MEKKEKEKRFFLLTTSMDAQHVNERRFSRLLFRTRLTCNALAVDLSNRITDKNDHQNKMCNICLFGKKLAKRNRKKIININKIHTPHNNKKYMMRKKMCLFCFRNQNSFHNQAKKHFFLFGSGLYRLQCYEILSLV